MTNLQTGIVILLGCVFTLLAMLVGKTGFQLRVCSWLRKVLVIKIVFSFTAILVLPFGKPNAAGRLPLRGIRIPSTGIGLFTLGALLTYLIVSRIPRARASRTVLLGLSATFCRLFSWAMAGIFIWSGVVKWVYPVLDRHFFLVSGYGQVFYVFITVVEILGGIGLLWRRTVMWAAAILILDMLGAIFTHYHNYFSRGLQSPFSNSIVPLTLVPFLIVIFVQSIVKKRRVNSAEKEIT